MVRDGKLAAGVAGALAVVYFAVGVFTSPVHQYRVQMELIDEATTWPWHSSLQRASVQWINSPEGQEWAGETTVEALPPDNIVDLIVLVSGDDADDVADAAEDTVDSFITYDIELNAEPIAARINVLNDELAQLAVEFDEQQEADQLPGSEAERAARSARLEGTAALIGTLETQRNEAEEELARQLTRYEVVDSGPVDQTRERLPETLKLFAGVLMLGFLALQLAPTLSQLRSSNDD